MLFESGYCNGPLCGPSRMSFMTGRLPGSIGAWGNGVVLPSDVPTFAHALGASGYQVPLIGRMHFRGQDQRHGFCARRVGDPCSTYPGGPPPVLEGFLPAAQSHRFGLDNSGPGHCAYSAFDQDVADAAVRYLSGSDPDLPLEEPFCAVVGFALPHCPFICDQDLFDDYIDKVFMPHLPAEHPDELHPYHQRFREKAGITDVDSDVARRARAAYYGMVTMLDRQVGRVLDALDAAGRLDDTVVIYTSDHGEAAGEHGLWWKSSFYEGSVGVPLIVSCPGRWQPGLRREVVSLVDLSATLCEVAGAPSLPLADGSSLMPLLEGQAEGWKDEAIAEHYGGDQCMRMVRWGPWKLNYYHGEPVELFHLDTDIDEFVDRSDDLSCQSVVAALRLKTIVDWNPRELVLRRRRQMGGYGMLRAWYEKQQPPMPEFWVPPPGSTWLADKKP